MPQESITERLQNPTTPGLLPSLLPEEEVKFDLAKTETKTIDVDKAPSPSKKDMIEKLQEALKTHKPHFSSYHIQTNHPPSIDLPYAHFTMPLQVGDLLFDVEPKELVATKNRENQYDSLLRFNYLGERFQVFITTYWFLEEAYGNRSVFPPAAFTKADENWQSSFKTWNTNEKEQQKYLTHDDLTLIDQMQILNGAVVINNIKYDINDWNALGYYLPDYAVHELTEDQKYLKITRSQPSCLVDVAQLTHISADRLSKIHTQTCLIPLPKGFTDLSKISYNKETRYLTLITSKN